VAIDVAMELIWLDLKTNRSGARAVTAPTPPGRLAPSPDYFKVGQ
jgi:hypothetical protein